MLWENRPNDVALPLRKERYNLRAELLASQKQNHDYEVKVADLHSQLDDMASQLEKAKLKGATNEETIRLTKENEMLRNIVGLENAVVAKAPREPFGLDRAHCAPPANFTSAAMPARSLPLLLSTRSLTPIT